jgi:hypothetical protein
MTTPVIKKAHIKAPRITRIIFVKLEGRLDSTEAFYLTAQQNEDTSRNSQDGQDRFQALKAGDQGNQSPGDKKNAQEQHSNIFCKFHDSNSMIKNGVSWRYYIIR